MSNKKQTHNRHMQASNATVACNDAINNKKQTHNSHRPGHLPLSELPIGMRARVLDVSGASAFARRLMEMGVAPGAPVRVIKKAPLGDPLEIRVRNYHLALRRTEAQTVIVTALGDDHQTRRQVPTVVE
jgi:Fe2+ transport system protein FeoA